MFDEILKVTVSFILGVFKEELKKFRKNFDDWIYLQKI
jgi:hypothetical protein